MNTLMSSQDAFYELSYYTLSNKDPIFIHQYIVDAYTAQYADISTKPIAITFALVGLFLHIEKNYIGRDVQKMHMLMAKKKRIWPTFSLPEKRGKVTVFEVLNQPPGLGRDSKIKEWSASVWEVYSKERSVIADLLNEYNA